MAVPAYRRIADELAQQIREGRFEVGEELPSITKVAEWPGSSLNKARDALKYLVEQGWAESRQGASYTVAQVPPEPPGEPLDWRGWREGVERRLAALEQTQKRPDS